MAKPLMHVVFLLSLLAIGAAHPAVRRPSLCSDREQAIFSCKVKSGKIVSLCASPDLSTSAGTLYYRFGLPGSLELTYPSGNESARTTFRRGIIGAAGGDFIRFTHAGATYTLEYADGPRVRDYYQAGVRVHEGSRELAYLPCARGEPDALGPDGFFMIYHADLPYERYELE